jgi:predicted ATPase
MKLERLRIKNFKSIVDLELVNPAPFSVFVGPNGAGKSNIFEALEYYHISLNITPNPDIFWNGIDEIKNLKTSDEGFFSISLKIKNIEYELRFLAATDYQPVYDKALPKFLSKYEKIDPDYIHLIEKFTRIFINNERLKKRNFSLNENLTPTTSNLEKVLKRILSNTVKKNEYIEWARLLIPEFFDIDVHVDNISGTDNFLVYEKFVNKPFKKSLISDGTYNILSLLTAVFQSDEPQFLCIEEPENGLHPQVIMTLVDFFRQQCEEKGHYIWLNTHSESLVRKLRPEEIILVDKREGATQVKQVRDMNLYDLPMDEAWLTGALGGGLPW